MPTIPVTKLTFAHSINSLLQIGDNIIWHDNTVLDSINSINTQIPAGEIHLGQVVSIGGNFICCDVEVTSTQLGIINTSGFVTFHKNPEVEETGLKGYYADLEFTNDSSLKSELFSVSSETSLSSK